MNLSRSPDTDIKILKLVTLQHVECECDKWEIALKGKDKLLIKRK